MSQSILIAGYYRSGTSALAGALNRAGVDIRSSAERNVHNPRGYYEIPEMIKLDIEVFRRLNRPWHDIRPMPGDYFKRPDIKSIGQRMFEHLQALYGESTLWAVKHPHICRLLPLYRDAAHRITGRDPAVVRILRDPWSVADSQRKKNGLSRTHALLLWASHIIEEERFSRGLRRVSVRYEQLVKDTVGVLNAIEDNANIELPAHTAHDVQAIAQFITTDLRRSSTTGRDETPVMLRNLVDEVWDAALSGGAPETFERYGDQLNDLCRFIDDLATTQLAATRHFSPNSTGGLVQSKEVAPTFGSTLRPVTRTDAAERKRILAKVEASGRAIPSYTVIVAVPKGRVDQGLATAESLEAQWFSPEQVLFLCADSNGPDEPGWFQVEPESDSITRELARVAQSISTDYLGVIDAGDTVEVDAGARLALTALGHDQPDFMYSDEIVASPRNPWIRYKPGFDIARLRSLAYLGSWTWIKTKALEELGGFNVDRAGAEELDIALRIHDAGGRIVHVPEALYARVPESKRDEVDVETLRHNCKDALTDHLRRVGLQSCVDFREGPIPGQFVLRHAPAQPDTMTLVLLTDDALPEQLAELSAESLASLLDNDAIERVICAGTGPTDRHVEALDALAGTVNSGCIQVVVEASEAKLIRSLKDKVTGPMTLLMSLDAESEAPDWLTHLRGTIHNDATAGIVGLSSDYPDPSGERRLIGPLLYPADGGYGVLGLGRKAGDPGLGGWLLSPQSVDGIIPVCLAIRNEVLSRVKVEDTLCGMALWLDLALQCSQVMGYRVIWDPTIHMHCSRLPMSLETMKDSIRDHANKLRARWPRQGGSPHHHPHLALSGDTLAETGQPDLRTMSLVGEPVVMATGSPDQGEFVTEYLKRIRDEGHFITGWAQEPVSNEEINRLKPNVWFRLNPERIIKGAMDCPYQAIYTKPPTDFSGLNELGKQVDSCFATSPHLAKMLHKRSRKTLRPEVVQPRLSKRIWEKECERKAGSSNNIRVLWVDEGDPPSWMGEILSLDGVDWFVVENGDRQYNGPIATLNRPRTEEAWRTLFDEVTPDVLIRPTRDETWMDCHLLLRAAAAGAMLITDFRLDCPDSLPRLALGRDFDDWYRAIYRIVTKPEIVLDPGKQARRSVVELGWIEDVIDGYGLFDIGHSQIEGTSSLAMASNG